MKLLNPATVLCTEAEFLNPEMHAEITALPFQFVLKSNGKVLRRFKTATQKWLAVEVDKVPGVTNPFEELGVTREALVPSTMLNENINFLPEGKIPVKFFHQIVAFFRAVMQHKMSDVLKGYQGTGGGHNYEAQIFVVYNPESGYRLAVPTQRVSAASVSYDHDCYDQAAGDSIVLDVH